MYFLINQVIGVDKSLVPVLEYNSDITTSNPSRQGKNQTEKITALPRVNMT